MSRKREGGLVWSEGRMSRESGGCVGRGFNEHEGKCLGGQKSSDKRRVGRGRLLLQDIFQRLKDMASRILYIFISD